MRIKIISDGAGLNTKVIDADTGEIVNGVISVKWELTGLKYMAKATIEIVNPQVELIGETE